MLAYLSCIVEENYKGKENSFKHGQDFGKTNKYKW
jgi:hypothetical protein